MPRGKYVNHKGRSRKFTAVEELQRESSSEEEGSSENEETGGSGAKTAEKKPVANESSSEEEDSDDDEARGSKKGVAGLIEIENPNRQVKKTAQKLSSVSLEESGSSTVKAPELTRREREQLEKQKQRQRYEKLHAEGKTSEAKADLARLALIRQQRAEAAAKRDAEKKALEAKKSGSKA